MTDTSSSTPKLGSRNGIPVIDIIPVFAAHPAPITLWIGHYSPEGYKLVADTVLARLRLDGALKYGVDFLARFWYEGNDFGRPRIMTIFFEASLRPTLRRGHEQVPDGLPPDPGSPLMAGRRQVA